MPVKDKVRGKVIMMDGPAEHLSCISANKTAFAADEVR
jgi:hypothetical protein